MDALDHFERAALHTLYGLGERVEHRHDHEERAVVSRLERAGLYAHHTEDALERLLAKGLVESRRPGRVKAVPVAAALALGFAPPLLSTVTPGQRTRPSALALA